MMVIRPVKASDLDGLMELARSAGVGLTSLPVNEERLSARIARSEKSFSGEADLAVRMRAAMSWATALRSSSIRMASAIRRGASNSALTSSASFAASIRPR